ncbi:MAG: VWA domain-containing protein [Acidobacteriales bacterium]|nr:VWA domain-containing protein [Terriglobales bacterium]
MATFATAQDPPKQDQQKQDQSQEQQNIPDAPSASRPPQPFPSPSPSGPGSAEEQNSGRSQPTPPGPPPNAVPPNTSNPATSNPSDTFGGPPPFKVATVPEGGSTAAEAAPNEELFKLKSDVNFVEVPVTVKDDTGRMVDGLLAKDFSVYEDGKKQVLKFFTSDPIALSVAVIFDLGMADVEVQKVNQTFPALQAAFSQFDEVSVYTYSSSVSKASDFSNAGQRLSAVLNDLKTASGRNNSPPITGGPMGPQGPTINGRPVDPSTPAVITPPQESHVLNDAILRAAQDLSKRDKSRRKIIFIVSDGREYRSTASYRDVLRVLLSNGIMVYGIGTGGAAIPFYNKLEKLHLPKMGYSDILPKYANATGGEIFNEYSRSNIQSVYARAIGDARNQYTLGYTTRAVPSSAYREIEVKVANHGPSCKTSLRPCVDVFAREGYYPLPRGSE